MSIDSKLILVTNPLTVPIVDGESGPDLGQLTAEQKTLLGKAYHDDEPLMFSVIYDLRRNSIDFELNGSNTGNGRHNVMVDVSNESGFDYSYNKKQRKALSKFLQNRRQLEEKLGDHRMYNVMVLVYRHG